MRVDTRDLLARVDLAALLTEISGEPVGSGARRRWQCPDRDHTDTDPSVTMQVGRDGLERWRCWSGDHHGTAIDAIMASRGIGFVDALGVLETKAGVEPRPIPAATGQQRQRTPPGPSTQLKRWVAASETRLWTPAGDAALAVLRDRTISDEVIFANRCGAHAGNDRRSGLPPHAGIVIPSFDHNGELVFAQSRNLSPTAPHKYSNPRGRHARLPVVTFPRGGPAGGPVLITEGVLDGLVAATAGYRSAALVSAAVVTDDAAQQIVDYARGETIVLALDGDTAGAAATSRLRELLNEHTTGRVVRLSIPDGEDLTSLRQTATRKETIPCTTSMTSSMSFAR